MGTNYYIACKYCETRLKHIGKQNHGHKFEGNVSKERFMRLKLDGNEIICDEYGGVLTKDKLMNEVANDWDLHENGEYWFDAGDNGWC